MRNLVWPGVALALLGISAVAIGGIYPLAVQSFTVKPSIARQGSAVHPAHASTPPGTAFGIADVETDAVHGADRDRRRPSLATDTDDRAEHPAARPGRGHRDVHPATSRSAAFYDFADKLDIDRYTVDGKAAGLRGRRAGDQLRRADRAADELAEPAHRLHPRVRLRGRAGQQRSATAQPFFVSGFLGGSRATARRLRAADRDDPGRRSRGSTTASRSRPRTTRSSARPTATRDAEFDRPAGDGGDAALHLRRATAACRSARSSRRLLYALQVRGGQLPALRRVQRQLEGDVRAQPARPGASRWRRSSPSTATRTRRWSTAGSRGSSTATRRRRPTRTRSGSTCRPRRPTTLTDAGTVPAGPAEHQLHPQLGEGHRGRLRRHGDALRVRRRATRSSRPGTRRSAATSSSRRRRSRRSWRRTSATRRTCSRCSGTC